jgi:hypothetical protein
MSGSTIRIEHPRLPFAQVPHAVIEDIKLSWKAKGIYAYLIGRPAGWRIHRKDLENRATDGKAALQTALKELQDRGYLAIELEHGERGRFVGSVWHLIVPENTENPPYTDYPDTVKPEDGLSVYGKSDHITRSSIKQEGGKQITTASNEAERMDPLAVVLPRRMTWKNGWGVLMGLTRKMAGLDQADAQAMKSNASVLQHWRKRRVPVETVAFAILGARMLAEAGDEDAWLEAGEPFDLKALQTKTLFNQGDGRTERPFFDVCVERYRRELAASTSSGGMQSIGSVLGKMADGGGSR